jgi:hypothetical protein
MFAVVFASALLTPSSPWITEHSELLGSSGFTLALFRLTPANNGSGYTGPFTVTLNGPVSLVATVWEDDLDTGTAIYCDWVDVFAPTGIPALIGTDLHTFSTSSVAFAVFNAHSNSDTTWSALDAVSYDSGYTEFADTGMSLTSEPMHMWMATKASTSFSGGGVTATLNNSSSISGILNNSAVGMIAYNQVVATPTAPANTVAPAVTGTAVTGQTLSCTSGTWTGYPTPTFTYQWKRNGTAITGATNNTYVLVTADEGTSVKCTVTATNASGAVPADSNTVSPTSGAGGTPPSNTVAPSLTGTPVTGNLLTCSAGTWTGTPTPTYSYSWKRDGTALGVFTNTYTLSSGDAGHSILCSVTATNAAGASTVNSNSVTVSSPTPGTVKQATVHRLRAGAWEVLDLGGGSSGGSSGGFVHSAQPEDYGAKGDGKYISDATMSSGSTTLTSAAGGFVSTDVGKKILVRGAGTTANGQALVANINTYVSATNVTLSTAATNAVSGVVATYGTDDTAAFKTAINTIVNDAINDLSYAAELELGAKVYIVAGAPVVGGTTAGNAQIPLPMIPTTGKKFILSIKGPVDGSHFYHWKQQAPATSGAVIHSFMVGVTQDATWLAPSCIGGPTVLPSDDGTAPFSNMLFSIDGVSIMAPRNPCFVGLDLKLVGQVNIGRFSCNVNASPNKSGGEAISGSATNQQGMGLRMPAFQNNDNTNIWSYGCEGFYYGMAFGDHFTAQRLALIYCDTAMYCQPGGAAEHGASIAYISCEACNTGLECNGSSGGRYPVFIGRFDVEVLGAGVTFKDPQNCLTGEIHYAHNALNAPTLTGALNVKIIDDHRYAGYVSSGAPAVPASTTALRNPFFREAAVFISGGTVTAVQIEGQTTFTATNCMVIVPNNKTITLTYSSAPTWKWFLF